ncbi:MAG: YczE/YyaS/YitT family protein [Pseudonocardiaceae bacterium]
MRRDRNESLVIGSPVAQLREGRLIRRFTQLAFGLVAYGVSMAFLVRSTIGVMPWDVLHQGLTRQVGLSLGFWSVITSLTVLLLWIPLRQLPGTGTVCNVFVIGVSVDVALALLPTMTELWAKVAFMVVGVLLNAVATAAYVGVRLGPGPRDGLMTGLTVRTKLPLRLIRTGIEVIVVAIGWLLGGTFGVGTAVYALLIGPLVQWLLPLVTVRPKRTDSAG